MMQQALGNELLSVDSKVLDEEAGIQILEGIREARWICDLFFMAGRLNTAREKLILTHPTLTKI